MSVNSYRSQQTKIELDEIEKEIKAAQAKAKYDSEAPAREAAAQQKEHELRELKKRLLLDPAESHDFQFTAYDGRLNTYTPAQVTQTIRDTFQKFLEIRMLDEQAQNLVKMFAHIQGSTFDSTRIENWIAAEEYLTRRLYPAEAPAPIETAVNEPENVKPVNPYPMNSRLWEAEERRIYQAELLQETVGDKLFHDTVQEIFYQTPTLHTLTTDTQLKFRAAMSLPVNRKRYTFTREGIRLFASEYFAETSFLTEAERQELAYRRNVAAMTSDDMKRAGVTVTSDECEGYAARRY